ncbi:ferritin-like domain-containing protein [Deinococcus hopiensis]|uniref:Tat (Twin-arginine translocation) pathway signal sequence n=1 Tax=Deinococcus hopiensis KR-140 TaxID=695939 RepID=A0A1W1V9B9_9DEIO|nr:ferritin-like domain-containing protein [Deinococcus hopiensis]SMB89863.1 Tat (twin-arginine translocation) pathway signal sequence [Deinococcus hopiensis KR-140]
MSNDTQGTSTRRKFLGMAGMMGAGAVLSGCTSVMATTPNKPNLDAVIFNFALNLEYLEAAFYLAAVGRLAELNGVGGDSTKITLPQGYSGVVPGLTGDMLAMANEIATDELAHVRVIRQVLGNAAVPQPQLDLSGSFAAAGDLASEGKIKGFNPYAGELFFLHGAFIFEDVGVTAYKGAARFLVDDSAGGNLENAAGILAVEAYHAGSIRTQLYQRRTQQAAAGLTVEQIVQAISNLRDAVDGADDRDQALTANPANPGVLVRDANIVPTDANGIAFSRTPRQVANIVFLDTTGAAAKGGFFPNGLSSNGTATSDYSAILAIK